MNQRFDIEAAERQFRDTGFAELCQLFAGDELDDLVKLFDEDRQRHGHTWRELGHSNAAVNCDVLLTSPPVDAVIRHQQALPLIERLFGGPVTFSEITLRHMRPYSGEEHVSWHRDHPLWEAHPLRLEYMQLMVYLTDVTAQTHCFSISPQSLQEPVLDDAGRQLQRNGVHHCHGPAGTAVLFNSGYLHTATLRPTTAERKSIQIYYGHAGRPPLNHFSAVPATLWRDNSDESTRQFYGNLNDRTRLFARNYSPRLAE